MSDEQDDVSDGLLLNTLILQKFLRCIKRVNATMLERFHNLIFYFAHWSRSQQTNEGCTPLKKRHDIDILMKISQALHFTHCLLALAAALLLTPVLSTAADPVVEMPPMPGQAYHPAAQSNSDKNQPELPPELKKIDEQIKHDASVLSGGGELHSADGGGGQQQMQESAVGQTGQATEGTDNQHETSGAGVVTPASSTAPPRDGVGTVTDKTTDQALQATAPQAAADASGKVATPQSPMPRDKDDDKDTHGGLIVFLVAAVAVTLFLLRKYFRR